jgi:hypothetical protein
MERADITMNRFRWTFRDWAAECTNFPNHVGSVAGKDLADYLAQFIGR